MDLGSQPLMARDEEYVFRVPPALVISGSVVDAQTRQPVKKFQVVSGVRYDSSQLGWSDSQKFTATDGTSWA